jgi:hypothetical protein
MTTLVASGVLLLHPFSTLSNQPVAGPPFVIRVIDTEGAPVPNVTITADNGLRCRTNARGETRWPERSVRRPGVQFHLQSAEVLPSNATLNVTGGVASTVVVSRRSLNP